jgi:hypothetical protein
VPIPNFAMSSIARVFCEQFPKMENVTPRSVIAVRTVCSRFLETIRKFQGLHACLLDARVQAWIKAPSFLPLVSHSPRETKPAFTQPGKGSSRAKCDSTIRS